MGTWLCPWCIKACRSASPWYPSQYPVAPADWKEDTYLIICGSVCGMWSRMDLQPWWTSVISDCSSNLKFSSFLLCVFLTNTSSTVDCGQRCIAFITITGILIVQIMLPSIWIHKFIQEPIPELLQNVLYKWWNWNDYQWVHWHHHAVVSIPSYPPNLFYISGKLLIHFLIQLWWQDQYYSQQVLAIFSSSLGTLFCRLNNI